LQGENTQILKENRILEDAAAFLPHARRDRQKPKICIYTKNSCKGKVSAYCRVLNVSMQGYAKYLKSQAKPYKYATLLANIKKILADDIFNRTHDKRRMFEKLLLDYNCPYYSQ